jgi:hypothetical protein
VLWYELFCIYYNTINYILFNYNIISLPYDEATQIEDQLSNSTFYGKSIIFSYINKKYVNITIGDFSICYGGLLLATNRVFYSCALSGSNNPAITYIGGSDSTNPEIPTTTITNKTIMIQVESQYTHWLGIIYGQVPNTIQSISASTWLRF